MGHRRGFPVVLSTAAVVLAGVAGWPSATAAPGGPTVSETLFATSFEDGQPAPKWASTVETDPAGTPRTAGVDGSDQVGIPGDVTDRITDVEANAEHAEAGEVKENLVDGSTGSKWLAFTPTGWAEFTFPEPVAVRRYALTSADDEPERDPRDWSLSGSADGTTWTPIDTRAGEVFTARHLTKTYETANTAAFRYYRIDITANAGGVNLLQLAEIQFSDGSSTPPAKNMRTTVGKGAVGGYNAKAGAGFTGVKALRYQGTHVTAGRGYSYNKVFEVDIPVTATTELSYLVFPSFTTDDLNYPSTFVAVDLAFADGTYLSDLGARDQHGFEVSPRGQGAAKSLYTNQWNRVASVVGKVAAGKTVKRILVAYDNPTGPASFNGWIDDIAVKSAPAVVDRARPTDHVLTTRGTNSSGSFSRGNNFPATAVPHGFNFWSPMTNAGSISWLYEYAKANNRDNLPTLQAFTASHEPSPWMGDRQTFQVMPSAGTPTADRAQRALPFRHENEIARAHYYGVTFENGMRTEIAPTDHAALFRFTFTGDASTLVFDNVNNSGGLSLDPATGVVSGFSDVKSGLSTGATRMFVYGVVDRPVTASGRLTGAGRDDVAGYLRFDTSTEKAVTLRIATSLLGVDQARRNLELEVSTSDTFDTVRDRAQAAWDEVLRMVEVEGATEDQLTTLYSNLYRLYLYPNSGYENTGTADAPKHQYASPVQPAAASTPTRTGAKVVDGKIYVNNGFWDTYRTTWPAYSLFTPKKAGELADGFVQQYRDGGWISRWSSPGYANLMTGTSSDVAFADAFVKGVEDFDVKAAFDAAVKNATVAPPGAGVGRKGLDTSIFTGYTSTATGEGMSWAIEGYVNDHGIATMAKALHEQTGDPEYLAQHEYFANRAQNYVHMFDPGTGFFRGRKPDGTWRVPAAEYDPREWGHDYTETDGWNMAFSVPHDGQGLANLYGGKDGLAKKLDDFFALPETAKFPGSYGGVIHEMTEARDVRMGQLGHSNQVSHHIAYMYDYAGQPWKTQEKVREILSRLYLGSEIGQGYPGDEDNGEQSAWYLFSALGFYPLQMGDARYAVGSPLFTKATVNLENGRKLVVNAPKNSARNIYVQSLKVNGTKWDKAYLPHADIAQGGTLDFEMGPEPSKWATGADAAPPSPTTGTEPPKPLRDVTSAATVTGSGAVTPLLDNTSQTAGSVSWLQIDLKDHKEKADFYTLTSAKSSGDPAAWVLKGSYDGTSWSTVDERSGEVFPHRRQTRAFKIPRAGHYRHYRLEFPATATLAEVELLAKPATTCTTTITDEHRGPLRVRGSTCVDGGTVTGPVVVDAGASLHVFGGKLHGPLSAAGAAAVVLVDSEVGGPVTITGTTGELALEHTTIDGPVNLVGNRGGTTVAANTVGGPLSCVTSNLPPANNGWANEVHGPKIGQCAKL
ncbi:GH92 family glycosyl hydrolase [Actinosynnema sp. NPDC047251]|uniref:Alpha-1,2-mannosidase n=1 Tax=Saccharothrix espanaensis (strain ATCC 51144 / DSM 44229 / JCM 9112 / NBRC 15066 / NRRL 15764) TaxID=1179773 RepID=K0K341_SACES|nr:GH92 family glycosyl hydrolase [Saccharothrix espanaensis]CCH34630.1 alpha-1,2-mannosidase [Saccharothrix espanaensis DSM 44229]